MFLCSGKHASTDLHIYLKTIIQTTGSHSLDWLIGCDLAPKMYIPAEASICTQKNTFTNPHFVTRSRAKVIFKLQSRFDFDNNLKQKCQGPRKSSHSTGCTVLFNSGCRRFKWLQLKASFFSSFFCGVQPRAVTQDFTKLVREGRDGQNGGRKKIGLKKQNKTPKH